MNGFCAGYIYLSWDNRAIDFHVEDRLATEPAKVMVLRQWLDMAYDTLHMPAASLFIYYGSKGACIALVMSYVIPRTRIFSHQRPWCIMIP